MERVDGGIYETQPYLMTILSKKFENVTNAMTQTLLRSARSGVINSARDFSSGITLADGQQFMINDGLPIHLGNINLAPEYALEHFDDISPGDCFLTNSPYAGNTHHADYTIFAPVFVDDELHFWVVNRAHQADVGAPEPTTYLPEAKSVYEEGPHFPAVRVQEDYDDNDDVIRLCTMNIRAGEQQWYGDYRAQVAAVREGERQLEDLCEEYGVETITTFTNDWLQYSENMMRSEIRSLADETLEYTAHHDPIPEIAEEPVPIHVEIDIRPEEEYIVVDLTDNVDNLDCGFNLSRATTLACGYGGVLQNVDSTVPPNFGSFSRVDVELASGTAVGEPDFPVGTSAATTNFSAVLFNAVQAAFGQLGEPYGVAEGNSGVQATTPSVSGTDSRNGGEQFVNQIIFAAGGGPAAYGNDGWMTYTTSVSCGVVNRDSVEINEQKFPILVRQHEFQTDSAGAGRWRGTPSSITEFQPREDSVTFSYVGNGEHCPPQGIRGGDEGSSARVSIVSNDGEERRLPVITMEPLEVQPGESLVAENVGGGGYGDPADRDPERVLEDVRAGYVSIERARDVYDVPVVETTDGFTIEGTDKDHGMDPVEVAE